MKNKLLNELIEEIKNIENIDERITAINNIKKELHKVSPLKDEPVDCVLWVKADTVHANDYNPNKVAPPEMRLLHTSIEEDGYTQPIVTADMQAAGECSEEYYEVVDGFHRNRVGKEYKDIADRIHNYLPITLLVKPKEERISSTIRHNRARGTHGIRPMSEIVLDLTRYGWSDEKICKELGMELDEVLRLKQITGLKDAFMNHEFSRSWEEFENKYYKEDK